MNDSSKSGTGPDLTHAAGEAGDAPRERPPWRWKPAGTSEWVLTVAAALLALMGVVTAVAVLWIVSPLVLLRIAVLAFPLHLLLIALVTCGLVLLARRQRMLPAALCLTLAVVLAVTVAVWPTVALWRRADGVGVPVSLGTYAANSLNPNFEDRDPRRSRTYATLSDGTRLELDVWRARASGSGGRPHPAVVKLHGGAWVAGYRSQQPKWNIWLNNRGYDVFDVEYRLAPPERWKDAVGDVKCALGWVAAHADEYGVDPSRISTLGMSAGGNLAMLAAYTTDAPALPPSCDVPKVRVKSAVSLFGPPDITRLYDATGSTMGVGPALRKYIGGTPRAFPERYRAVSPLSRVGADSPPTLAFQGESDFFPATATRLLGRSLHRAQVPHETVLLPGTSHSYDANWGGFATQITRAKLAEFLRRRG
ncbi:alpha/beta hydrolase fold domain-containing protein [Streptomyces monticola]|uniref:Alpha/beta hydrolase fold domain-containing protein n=1 Tax=Streptomyces monticola TaxID=2666263 RepID=A0ABW2JRU7_9ACTN